MLKDNIQYTVYKNFGAMKLKNPPKLYNNQDSTLKCRSGKLVLSFTGEQAIRQQK